MASQCEGCQRLAQLVDDWSRDAFQSVSNESSEGQQLIAHLREVFAHLSRLEALTESQVERNRILRSRLAAAEEQVAALSGRDANGLARKVADKHDEIIALKAEFEEFADKCAGHCSDRDAEQIAAEDAIAKLEGELARQRDVNRNAARVFMRGLERHSADVAEAQRQSEARLWLIEEAASLAEECAEQRDELARELAELRARVEAACATGAAWSRGGVGPDDYAPGTARRLAELMIADLKPAAVAAGTRDGRDGAERGQEGPNPAHGTTGTPWSPTGGAVTVPDRFAICAGCDTPQHIDGRDRVTGHHAPGQPDTAWCSGSWKYAAGTAEVAPESAGRPADG